MYRQRSNHFVDPLWFVDTGYPSTATTPGQRSTSHGPPQSGSATETRQWIMVPLILLLATGHIISISRRHQSTCCGRSMSIHVDADTSNTRRNPSKRSTEPIALSRLKCWVEHCILSRTTMLMVTGSRVARVFGGHEPTGLILVGMMMSRDPGRQHSVPIRDWDDRNSPGVANLARRNMTHRHTRFAIERWIADNWWAPCACLCWIRVQYRTRRCWGQATTPANNFGIPPIALTGAVAPFSGR